MEFIIGDDSIQQLPPLVICKIQTNIIKKTGVAKPEIQFTQLIVNEICDAARIVAKTSFLQIEDKSGIVAADIWWETKKTAQFHGKFQWKIGYIAIHCVKMSERMMYEIE